MQIPPEFPLPENPPQGSYPGQYGSVNPYQQLLQHQNMVLANNGLDLQNNLLQMTLQSLWKTRDQGQGDGQPQTQPEMGRRHTNRGSSLDQTRGDEDAKELYPNRLGRVSEGSTKEADSSSAGERYRPHHSRSRFDHARARRGIMSMANSPLSASLLSSLSEK